MANGLYTNFYDELMRKTIDLDTADVKVALLDVNYVVNLATDTDYNTFASHAEIMTGTLAGTTVTNGVFDANNYEFPNVTHGSNAKYIVVFHEPSDYLVAYFENGSAGAINIPCVGNDIYTEWNASGIFAFANCP